MFFHQDIIYLTKIKLKSKKQNKQTILNTHKLLLSVLDELVISRCADLNKTICFGTLHVPSIQVC